MFYKELIKGAHNDLKHKDKVTERQINRKIQTQKKTDGQKRKTERQTIRQTNNKLSKRRKMQNVFYEEECLK